MGRRYNRRNRRRQTQFSFKSENKNGFPVLKTTLFIGGALLAAVGAKTTYDYVQANYMKKDIRKDNFYYNNYW
jgi:hypothetical protein